MSTFETLTSSSLSHLIGTTAPGVSASPPLGLLTYAVGARPPFTPTNPRCLGTCMTMQWIAPASPMIASQLICTTVLEGNAACRVASTTELFGATVALVYEGTMTTSLHMTMLQ